MLSEVARDANQRETGLGDRVAERGVLKRLVGQDGDLGGAARVEDDLDVLDARELREFLGDAHDAVSARHSVNGQLDGAIDLGAHVLSLRLGLDEASDGRGRLIDLGLRGLIGFSRRCDDAVVHVVFE